MQLHLWHQMLSPHFYLQRITLESLFSVPSVSLISHRSPSTACVDNFQWTVRVLLKVKYLKSSIMRSHLSTPSPTIDISMLGWKLCQSKLLIADDTLHSRVADLAATESRLLVMT